MDITTNDYDITLGGDWNNTGNFTERDGTVTFNGSGDQTITRTSVETFNNLIVNKSVGKLILSDTVKITNYLFNELSVYSV